jgi:outer membrane protein TolC
MKYPVSFLCIFLLPSGLFGQASDSLSLELCLQTAAKRSPLNDEIALSEESLAYKLRNLGTNWFPAIGANAQALYNSETVNFSDALKNLPVSIPGLPLDQYKLVADINQQIYDGGMTKAQKSVEKASNQADIHQVEAELLGIKQQVNQAYFSLLLTRKSADVLQVSIKDLQERKKVVRAGVENGILLRENLLAMDAEELRYGQRLLELKLTSRQLIQVLSILLDSTISENTGFELPMEPPVFDSRTDRPEYLVFDRQKDRLQASEDLVTASDMPKLFAFSQAGYGRPGYNFVSRDFHGYYSVGVGLKWNFLNYGDSKRQKKIFEIQKGILDVKRKTFDDQLDIQLEAEKTNQQKYTELIIQDVEILKLREAIASASFAKLTNGTITTTDYFSEVNNELLARLQFENHKIMKLQAAYSYLLLKGKL